MLQQWLFYDLKSAEFNLQFQLSSTLTPSLWKVFLKHLIYCLGEDCHNLSSDSSQKY
jgi:hypothetical protein